MRTWLLSLLSLALASLGYSASAFAHASEGRQADVSREPAKLTVLFDAFGRNPKLQKDWGYAALIEVGGRRILFDTGNNPTVFKHNVEALGVDLTTLDDVVISHRHGDHTSGLAYLLSLNPNVRIYAPKDSFGVFGASLPSTFYRKDPALPKDMRYFDGAPSDILRFGAAWPDAHFQLVDTTRQIAPGIHVIALVSDKPGTLEMTELSLAIETPEGMVLVVGCSHPGIERIVDAARAIDQRIHLIAGGLHLVTTPDAEVDRQVRALHETYQVAWIAAGHCTGEPAFAALLNRFGNRSVYAGVGASLSLGANPRAEAAGTRHTLGADDFRTYRQVLRSNLLRFGRPAKEKQPSGDLNMKRASFSK